MITPAQIAVARKPLGWSTATLAKKAKLSALTVAQVEQRMLSPNHVVGTTRAIQAALETAGVEFTAKQPGVRLRTAPL